MMVHAAMHWPEEFSMDLWPYAMDYSAHLYNNTPSERKNEMAPIEYLCNVQLGCKSLTRARVWGCPAYVLDPRLQDGKKIPKFEKRARLAMFLGLSALHSSLIRLI